MLGNPKGELRICPDCKREHDILRGTRCWCACGKEIRSKEFVAPRPLFDIKFGADDFEY